MPSIIQLLPDHVANQIAAGEVVQRPASVVKELVENAVDAGATEIKLIIKEAGKALIQVIDNGKGMNVTDARLCFERHATSKIRQAEDLFALHTKGFRGEALASIAAIAHVELKTKQEQDELGTQLIIEGSRFMSQDAAVLPIGTSFSIKNLFFNIPARRNFLKSDTVEHRHVVDEFQRIALAHQDIAFSFHNNGGELYNLPKSNLRQRIVNVFGGKTNEKLIPIAEDTDLVKIDGFVCKPEFSKRTRGEQYFFVNNRFIKSGYLHHAVISAYEGLLPVGVQPSYFIYLEVPPSSIDINIHPTKTEIKFDDEHSLYAFLRTTIKHSLGQFNVAPVLDFDRNAALDTPYHFKNQTAEMPKVTVDGGFNPFDKSVSGSNYSHKPQPTTMQWEGLYVAAKSGADEIFDDQKSILHQFESDTVSSSLFENSAIEKTVSRTFQINRKYIVNPIKSGIVIINQSRAHQRVLYEQFLEQMTIQKGLSQQLLFPLTLFFSREQLQVFDEIKNPLQLVGFVFDESNADHLVISGLPINITESEANTVIERLISDLQNGFSNESFSQNDSIAKSMARSLAVKNGIALTETAQENLINNLFGCREPNFSPFQKPTFITMNVDDIDKKFNL